MGSERAPSGFENTEGSEKRHPVSLSIAGSDSGGGAGLQADLRTFSSLGVHGATVVTLITAQNTRGVQGIEVLPGEFVRRQYSSVVGDFEVGSAKSGALGNTEMVRVVLECLQERPLDQLVIDPVMVSKHGDPLMADEAQELIRDELLACGVLTTPNPHEAQILSGQTISNVESMKEAARRIYDYGIRHVLVKGSHLEGVVRDIFFDGHGFIEYGADRIESDDVHGSGCAHSAAITARLALGDSVEDAIGFARAYISRAISDARRVGGGIQPVNPMHEVWK